MSNVFDFATSSNDGPKQGWTNLGIRAPLHCLLLENFRDALLVKGALLEELVKPGSDEARILSEVKREITTFAPEADDQSLDSKTKAWAEFCRMELFLMLAVPISHLYPEVQYRLSVAEKLGVKDTQCLNKMLQQLTANANLRDEAGWSKEVETNLRFLLIDTVKEIQREQVRRHLSKIYLKHMTKQLLIAGLSSCALFVLPWLLLRLNVFVNPKWSVAIPIWTCLAAGLFGAYFSRLIYIQKAFTTLSYDELISSRDTVAIVLRGSIGLCGAALLFFLLLSGIVEGGSFIPKATIELKPPTDIASKDLALLFVWGFFAGFSERLVPNILAKTERGLGSAERTRPGGA